MVLNEPVILYLVMASCMGVQGPFMIYWQSANEWLDCVMAADPWHRNRIKDDLLQLLFIKAGSDGEMNNKLKQVMSMIENMRQIYEGISR